REHRGDEDHHDQEDLPRHADRGIPLVADEMTHHDVVDDPLHSADDVLQHRRPGQLPDRVLDGALDDRAVERFSALRGDAHALAVLGVEWWPNKLSRKGAGGRAPGGAEASAGEPSPVGLGRSANRWYAAPG